jgi:hypothetical protein
VVHIYWRGYRSALSNYRHISLTFVICRQMEQVIAGYLKQVLDKNDCYYAGKHGFSPGNCCECQVITVCQDIWDCLDEGVGIDAIIINFFKTFDLVLLIGCLRNWWPRAWIRG